MFLRLLRCRNCIHDSILGNRAARIHTRSQWSRLSPTHFTASRLAPIHFKASRPEYNGRYSPKRSSIRPITLFAICIPIGYGLSLALKKHEDSIDTDGFIKYILASKEDVSLTSSIFTLEPLTTSAIRTDDPLLRRVITSVQFKQPQLQIARSYTLLPRHDSHDPHELRFLIRKEPNGEVSGYLHRLPLGSELELRGLSAEYILPEQVDTAVFLAGGTGITPAMQVARALAGEADVHILWANRRREDCAGGVSDTQESSDSKSIMSWRSLFGLLSAPTKQSETTMPSTTNTIVDQLDDLKQQSSSTAHSSLRVNYYVDEEGSFIKPQDVSRLLVEGNSRSEIGKKLLFVAGPDGFVNHWSASKVWMDGREVQGPLGGVLGTMDLRGWEVVKL